MQRGGREVAARSVNSLRRSTQSELGKYSALSRADELHSRLQKDGERGDLLGKKVESNKK